MVRTTCLFPDLFFYSPATLQQRSASRSAAKMAYVVYVRGRCHDASGSSIIGMAAAAVKKPTTGDNWQQPKTSHLRLSMEVAISTSMIWGTENPIALIRIVLLKKESYLS